MRKVETLNLLQDSNHLLRDERNRLSERLQELEAKVSSVYVATSNAQRVSLCSFL